MIASFLFVVLAALAADFQLVAAQYPMTFGPGGNVSSLVGTWASGAGNVMTGGNFANPTNRSFVYPKTAGISYSFTGDGHFEFARYRFIGNGSEPTCIKGVIGWAHGTYEFSENASSITLNPLEDGFQQVQDPCAAVSNLIENFNQSEVIKYWQVYQDTAKGLTARLYQFDGQPLPPMLQRSATPNMLPTQKLANASTIVTDQTGKSGSGLRKRSAAARQTSSAWKVSGLVVCALVGASVLLV